MLVGSFPALFISELDNHSYNSLYNVVSELVFAVL